MVKVAITYAISQFTLGNHSLQKHSLNTLSEGEINAIFRRNTISLMNISVLCSVHNYLATYPSPVSTLPQLEKPKVGKLEMTTWHPISSGFGRRRVRDFCLER